MRDFILLNPPGTRNYQRDAFCSKTAKGGAVYPPVDLLLQSGFLARDHRLAVIDAIAERLDPDAVLARLRTVPDPAGALVVTGIVSWAEDEPFLRRLRGEFPALPVFAIGDALLDGGDDWLQRERVLDGILYDYTAPVLAEWFRGRREGLTDLSWREGERVIVTPRFGHRGTVFTLPVPRYELFPYRKYYFPLARRHPFAFVISNYGCPWSCTFCATGSLGFKRRELEDTLANLRRVRELGIPELFIGDSTFAADREHALELLRRMVAENFGFSWSCFGRVDRMDGELLALMKRAGCHTVIFGVESGDDAVLARNGKGYTVAQVRAAFQLCDRLGLRTVATFIFGLPGETRAGAEATIALARELPCDVASFNIVVPRGGTPLARDRGRTAAAGGDQSGAAGSDSFGELTPAEAAACRRRAIRAFYLRPSYLLRRLRAVSSPRELWRNLVSALAVLRD